MACRFKVGMYNSEFEVVRVTNTYVYVRDKETGGIHQARILHGKSVAETDVAMVGFSPIGAKYMDM